MSLKPATLEDAYSDLQKESIRNGLGMQVEAMTPMVPGRVKVGHFFFTVCIDKSKLHDGERKKGGGALYGHVDFDRLEIVLDPAMPPQLMRDTLWHEVLHAIFWTVGMEGKLTEEQYTRTSATLELTALRDNPLLVAYLTAP